MKTILVIWTIVGYAGTQFVTYKEFDWRPIGEFQSIEHCKQAATELGVQPAKFRCIATGKTQ